MDLGYFRSKNNKMPQKLTPLRAIKKYCKEECCANDAISWRKCENKECPLYSYRKGKKEKVE